MESAAACTDDGASGCFAKVNGTHFLVKGKPFYCNGFNAYWLMYMASEAATREKVSSTLQQAAGYGITLARTWAFSDGGSRPLQRFPGSYNEEMFKGLDFVISEASKYGVYLILSLVNNHEDFGGKKQYVEWARAQGSHDLSSEDDFFRNEVVKLFYKNHVKAVLTRINTISGIAYKDDPTIFAWELINEPRCQSDLSGKILQGWISEMAGHVKSIDSNHLLEIGAEGFYGESVPERKQFNPGFEIGADFISNHLVSDVGFATIHAYPDLWMSGLDDAAEMDFLESWIQSHVEDAGQVLRKPLLITEFGKLSSGLTAAQIEKRDSFYRRVYDAIYSAAEMGGACSGGLLWQVLDAGMDEFRDGYEIVFSECPSAASIISLQSQRISSLNVI
ncbi:hypothetical protein Cni_G25505 [Canna indica]|uniref:mannan endo-1,4-beta-mannosidase n=1 Tax=Canna indica TaxID=4628 RepID=A0AAQ3L049_9LILI|nr:hypothetical protein Cni_G25505 [Canna indica]